MKELKDMIDAKSLKQLLERDPVAIPDTVLPEGSFRRLTKDEIESRNRMRRDIVAAACVFVDFPTLHNHKSLIERVEAYERDIGVFFKIARAPVPIEELTTDG